MARFFSRSFFFLAVLCSVTPIFVQAQVINEYVANHTGYPDTYEYIEIFGSPSTDYSDLAIIEIEGDVSTSTGTIGYIDQVFAVGATDGGGYWMTAYLTDKLENGSMTLLLVDGFTGAVGDDVDANNDGVMDTVFWSTIVDQVSVWDGDAGDGMYGAVVLSSSMDGDFYTPGGASRIPNGTDTDTVDDWRRNNFFGDGIPGLTGSTSPGEAYNTPGTENDWIPVPEPMINEFVLGHFGSDDHEFIEIFGMPETFYTDYWILVIDGDQEDAGHIDNAFRASLTGGGGAFATAFLVDNFEGNSTTILLVKDFTGAAGDDLDSNDDGALDVSPWSEITDGIAVTDGDAGDFAYATLVLDRNFDGMNTPVLGASRFRSGIDSDTAADWIRNDFDGAGLPGFVGTITSGEAYNTYRLANRVTVEDYYAAVDDGSQATLRSTVHSAIKDHIRHEYTTDSTDTWDILIEADEDPGDASNILTVYKNSSVDSGYNREHTWPKSFGYPDETLSNSPYTDCHQLMLADESYNTARSNRAFGTCSLACSEYVTDVNNGVGGGAGVYPGNSNWGTGTAATGVWEAWIDKRGDVARAQLYLDLRYEGGVHGFVGTAEPDLILTDNTGLIAASQTGSNESTAYMGRLAVLLQWAAEDPVSIDELDRNEVIYKHQGNRNPFVDHPEWISCIFEGTGCGGAIFGNGFEDGTTDAWSSTTP
ncbi:MAG: endonuclease [Acidobacteriota bacterium]